MDKISITYAPDSRYLPLALVSMASILKNSPNENIEFIILHSREIADMEKKIEHLKNIRNFSVKYILMDESEFLDFPTAGWVSVESNYRLKLCETLSDLDKVLYLDCDTMVRHNIAEFFNIDVSSALAAVVEDVYGTKNKRNTLQLQSESYFNAGIMLLNLKKCREVNFYDKVKQVASEADKAVYSAGDQDILNKAIDEDKVHLPMKYNYLEVWWHNYYTEYEGENLQFYEEAKKDPFVVHFTGHKPCDARSLHAYRNEFIEYSKLANIYGNLNEINTAILTRHGG